MTKAPRSNRLGMYSDVRTILDACLAAGGGEYVLADYGKAVHWRQRAYKFRKLYAETLGVSRESPYDAVIIRKPIEGSGRLILDIRTIDGDFRPSGNAATFDTDDDDLLDFASKLAKKLEGDEQ